MLVSLLITAWVTTAPSARAQLSVSTSAATTVCAGTPVTLTASGCPANGTLRWSTTQTGSSIVVTPTQSTTYSASCAVPASTTTTATAAVQVHPAIVLTPTSTSIGCSAGATGRAVLTATGGVGELLYQFNDQPFGKTTEFGNLKVGTYPVVVKDAVGCTVKASVEIKQAPPLSVSVTAVAAKCTGGSDGGLIAVASGGSGDYRYILDNGTPQVSGTFINLKANTTYSLLVADREQCILIRPVTIGAPVPFDITFATKPTRCIGSADGSVTVSATGGTGTYQYQLSGGVFQTGSQFTGLPTGVYEFTVRDGNGCLGSKSVRVEQPAPLQLTAVARPVSCFGPFSGSINVTPTGGTGAITYLLTANKIPQASNVFGGIGTGEYTVIGTDANGCTSPVSVTVGKSDPLKIQASVVAASCCVCPTGVVQLASTGGTGAKRQFGVNGGVYGDNSRIAGLRPNTYRFRVVDEVGCTDSLVAVVADAAAMSLATGKIKDVTCVGGKDGEATVQVTGGTRPFTYYWLTERRDTLKALTATQTSLAEGTYTVSVLDSNRCTTSTTFVPIKALNPVPTKPTVSQVASSTLTVDRTAGIQWYVQTGTDPAKPVADATQPTLVPFQSGQYYVVVTLNGCASPPSEVINFVLTALSEPVAGLSVRVVPNPVVDRLRLEIEQTERSAVQLNLLDASGRSVWQNQLPAFTGKKQTEWPLTGISTGTYLLRAAAGSRQSVLRVLVE